MHQEFETRPLQLYATRWAGTSHTPTTWTMGTRKGQCSPLPRPVRHSTALRRLDLVARSGGSGHADDPLVTLSRNRHSTTTGMQQPTLLLREANNLLSIVATIAPATQPASGTVALAAAVTYAAALPTGPAPSTHQPSQRAQGVVAVTEHATRSTLQGNAG